MKRITVEVHDELDARLRQESERRGKTVSEITREALESYLGGASKRRLRFAGTGASGLSGVSERIEQILAHDGPFEPPS